MLPLRVFDHSRERAFKRIPTVISTEFSNKYKYIFGLVSCHSFGKVVGDKAALAIVKRFAFHCKIGSHAGLFFPQLAFFTF